MQIGEEPGNSETHQKGGSLGWIEMTTRQQVKEVMMTGAKKGIPAH